MRYTLDEDAAVVKADGTRDALLSGTEVIVLASTRHTTLEAMGEDAAHAFLRRNPDYQGEDIVEPSDLDTKIVSAWRRASKMDRDWTDSWSADLDRAWAFIQALER